MPLKVLVVDDDIPTLEVMWEVLRVHGAEVHGVRDGQEATSLVNREKFDGIFLDLTMAKVDGFELTRAIRRSPWNHRTPIVILGKHDKQSRLQVFEAGATFFLEKPIDKTMLTAFLDSSGGAMLEMVEERRRFRRVSVRTEVTCQVGSRKITGLSANVSQDGILFQGDGSLEPGSAVRLAFQLPSDNQPIEVEGTVARVDEKRQVGVGFTHIRAQDQQRILELIISREGKM